MKNILILFLFFVTISVKAEGFDHWTFWLNKAYETIPEFKIPQEIVEDYPCLDKKYGKDWCFCFIDSEHLDHQQKLGICADTLIYGTAYRIIERVSDGNIIDSLYYRQDKDRIYRLSKETGTDELLYDFGLNLEEYFLASDGVEWKVEEIKNYCIGALQLKQITLKEKNNPDKKDIWLQGIGSLYTGILTLRDFPINQISRVIYSRDRVNSIDFNIDEELYKSVTLCPQGGTGPKGNSLSAEFIKDTLRISGDEIINTHQYIVEARVKNDVIHVKITDITTPASTNWSKVSRYIDVKIPGFTCGSYEVIYSYETKEKCMGNISCTMSDTDVIVPPIQGRKLKFLTYYDLSGRPVETPTSGLTIKVTENPDGSRETKKIIVK